MKKQKSLKPEIVTPFEGQVTQFLKKGAPRDIVRKLETVQSNEMLDPAYPYKRRLDRKLYEDHLAQLQIELVKMQWDLQQTGKRVVVVFEGRDTAGKGGAIARLTENLNPRVAHIIALPKPTEKEGSQWYFQRYAKHLPSAGEMNIFDRSWYNRAIVEHVFGFCTKTERRHFFHQLPHFENMLVDEGFIFLKFWLTVGRAEQLRRMLDRESDPLKQWKLSKIDVDGLSKWNAYTKAITETLKKSNVPAWNIVLSDDKRRARLAILQKILTTIDYQGRDLRVIGTIDKKICGGLELRSRYRDF